jgi:hypothetical protein
MMSLHLSDSSTIYLTISPALSTFELPMLRAFLYILRAVAILIASWGVIVGVLYVSFLYARWINFSEMSGLSFWSVQGVFDSMVAGGSLVLIITGIPAGISAVIRHFQRP